MDEPSTPTTRLQQALSQFCQEIASLKNSLQQVMAMFHEALEARDKELHNFIQRHGKDIREEDGGIHFNIDYRQRSQFEKFSRELGSISSAQKLIPRNFVVALICSFDALMGRIVRFVLEIQPKHLDHSERTIQYSDLLTFPDITSVKEYLVEKEIESVMRKSHSEQFKWLEKKLDTTFTTGLKSWPAFIELTERRNLFVHCDGVVSSQYIKVCQEHKHELPEDVLPGKRLGVSAKYFNAAFVTIHEIGVKLAHVIWRKLQKADLKDADTNLIASTYHLIQVGEYELAIRILSFFTRPEIKHYDDSIRRTMVVNLAQALKWSGDNEQCQSVLNKDDWSASEDRFKLAVAVLRDDFEAGFKLMKKLSSDDTFLSHFYREWPIFRDFILSPGFPAAYRDAYGESFALEEEVSAESPVLPNAEETAQGETGPA